MSLLTWPEGSYGPREVHLPTGLYPSGDIGQQEKQSVQGLFPLVPVLVSQTTVELKPETCIVPARIGPAILLLQTRGQRSL